MSDRAGIDQMHTPQFPRAWIRYLALSLSLSPESLFCFCLATERRGPRVTPDRRRSKR